MDRPIRQKPAGSSTFSPCDIPSVSLKRQWVPLWTCGEQGRTNEKWGCVFEPTVAQKAKWAKAANISGEWDQSRWLLEAFVDAVRDGDADDAKPIFNRQEHWDWLSEQSDAVISNAVQAACSLGMPDKEQTEAMRDFFASTPEESRSESSAPSASDTSTASPKK